MVSLHPGINITAHNPVRNVSVWIFLGCRELGARSEEVSSRSELGARSRSRSRHMESLLYGVQVVTCIQMEGTETEEREGEESERGEIVKTPNASHPIEPGDQSSTHSNPKT